MGLYELRLSAGALVWDSTQKNHRCGRLARYRDCPATSRTRIFRKSAVTWKPARPAIARFVQPDSGRGGLGRLFNAHFC